jgi:hypothetical protein
MCSGSATLDRPFVQTFAHRGYVKTDGQLFPCQLTEMTSAGATVNFDGPVDLPERFAIQLTPDGKVTRNCVVRWNEGTQFGVIFGDGDQTD